MNTQFNHHNLHRTAKYFMDSGRASTPEDALSILQGFGLTVCVGAELVTSRDHQVALLTLVNTARRTFLGGVEVFCAFDAKLLVNLSGGQSLREAITFFGGRLVSRARDDWPIAVIGMPKIVPTNRRLWQLDWAGWRGGVRSVRAKNLRSQGPAIAVAPIVAASICVAEVFAFHSGDHPMAGLRSAGVSLWQPGTNWLADDHEEPPLEYLPSRLWLVGLGNLGQAYAWILACLPYVQTERLELVLQDFDEISVSNDSTSLLSTLSNVGRKKTRVVSEWLEARGFQTLIEERKAGEWSRRAPHEPGVALWGVDNAMARMAIDACGFDLVIEAGLGAGPNGFRNLSLHTFPASRSSAEVWSRHLGSSDSGVSAAPAYSELRKRGMDECGLVQLASRTVGVPFVGLLAAALVVAELLRRLHGGRGSEQLSCSLRSIGDIESIEVATPSYAWGHVGCENNVSDSVHLSAG